MRSRSLASLFPGEGERVIQPRIGAENSGALFECELLGAALGKGDAGVGEGPIAGGLKEVLHGLG